ncbi:unnamed protein product [Paramecium sonneborni]|uniref:Mitochondrial carrier protein n=1 Tax=Paramecium sonneborni TaxID=65129 RepID=A0A8S1P0Q8_9CILI|nr:unnamed protein product [Paramecium sonneborni]
MAEQSISDVLSGAFAGVCFRLFGHPFDTIKVRMIMGNQNKSIFRVGLNIYKNEGFKAYYKGMLSPILAEVPCNAVMFAVYEAVYRELCPYPYSNQAQIVPWLIAGGVSGIAYALVVCPAEMIKCLLQMQIKNIDHELRSPFRCVVTLLQREGIRGMFKGLVATIIRDVPQNAAFFTTYEYTKYLFKQRNNSDDISFLQALVCGGMSGIACCLASYPLDVVKTQLQCEAAVFKSQRKFRPILMDGGVIMCTTHILQKNGIMGFFNGIQSCLIYYLIGCSAQFTGYYYAQQLFKQALPIY